MARTTDNGTDSSVEAAAQSLLAAESDNQVEDEAQDDDSEQDDSEVEDDDAEDGDELEAESEDADEEDDGEDESEDDESEGEDEDDNEDEEPALTEYTVKVDGEEVKVTLDELRNGYSRTADYSRKTADLAQQRKAAEQEVEQIRQERQYYANTLQQMQANLQKQQQAEPDWDKLYREDPVEWNRQSELHRRRKEEQDRLSAEQARVQQLQQQETQQQMKTRLEGERTKLLEAVPEWKDPEKAKADSALIRETGKKHGFTEQELAQVYDHRAVAMMRKAALYDKLMQKRETLKPKAKAKTAKKSATPGTPAKPGASKRRAARENQQKLANTGHVRDAARAIESLLGDS